MSTGVVGIFVSEKEYTEKVMDYLEERAGLPFKTIAFTVREELDKYLKTKTIDLLFISSEDMYEDIGNNVRRIILLSSGIMSQENKKYPSIFKYQSMETIIREMLEHYLEVNNETEIIEYKNHADIIAVYSPIGNNDKTLFSLTLGQTLATDKRVLYMNLEEFTAFEKLLEVDFSGDLADLMYFFKQNKEVLTIKLQAIVKTLNKLDYVPPMTFSEDLRNLKANQWTELLEMISIVAGYDVIIVDLGNMVNGFLEILEICKVIYLPINNNYIQSKRIEAFEEYLLRVERESILDKIIKFEMPYMESKVWSEEYFEEIRWSSFGDLVREIIDEERWNLKN